MQPTRAQFDAFYRSRFRETLAVVLALRGRSAGAEDVTQEAFARAWHRWSTVGVMDRPDLWVQRVALNLATSRLRRRGAEARAMLRLSSRTSDHEEPPGMEEAAGFWRLVRALPRAQARATVLFYVADLSIEEISKVLERAPGTIKSQLHSARNQLREQLTMSGSDDADR